jgi:predicted nucleotidyltransferase
MPRDGFLTGTILRQRVRPEDRQSALTRLASCLSSTGAVLFAYVFGSFIEERDPADLDLAVYLDPGRIEGARELDEQIALTGLAERLSGLPVDVVILNTVPLGLRLAALKGRLLFSKDEESRYSFIERTGLQAMDTTYLRRESARDLVRPGV